MNRRTFFQVCFAGIRIIDNGTVCEGEGARTHRAVRGTGARPFQMVRAAYWRHALRAWPQLKLIRFVTIGVDDVRKHPETMTIIPHEMRVGDVLLFPIHLCSVCVRQ